MSIIEKYKEQRQKDKEEFFEKLEEAKQVTKDAFDKEKRNERLQANISRMQSQELRDFSKTQYKTHILLIWIGILLIMPSIIFPPLAILVAGFEVSGLICMIANWKRINEEYKKRKSIK